MKTSKKLLLILGGLIIVFLITTLFALRKDIKTLMESLDLIEYKAVTADKFVSLDFSSNWEVTIRQGKDCKIELALKENSNLQPILENKSGTLFLSTLAIHENKNTGTIYARVTAPILNEVKAVGNTEILMKNFWSDSITVILKDSSSFSGKNNDFTNIFFKALDNDE